MAIITSPENQKRLDHYKRISKQLALAGSLTDQSARALTREGKAVIFMDFGLHANETVGAQALIELVYQMVTPMPGQPRRPGVGRELVHARAG